MIKRHLFNKLVDEIDQPEVLVLLGARQVGKTTLLQLLEDYAGEKNLRAKFYDLEQPDDLKRLSGNEEEVINELTSGADIVFIDEFYYLKDAGKLFKAIFDRVKRQNRYFKIVVSGSSAMQIHSHLRESLAGRMIKYSVYPLSFSEIKSWCNDKDQAFSEYLSFGALPGVVTVKDQERKLKLLQDYVSSYILKDIKSLIKEENVRAFNNLLFLLAESQGQLVEVSSLSREVGLSAPTVSSYLEILNQTFVNFTLSSYHTNLGNELKKSKKQYFYDIGVRNSILKDFRGYGERPDKGALFESFVFLNLLHNCPPNCEIRFWRNKQKHEVDFVAVLNREPIPIEVKSRISREEIPKGLSSFIRSYPATRNAIIVNQGFEDEIVLNQCNVKYIKIEDIGELDIKDVLPLSDR